MTYKYRSYAKQLQACNCMHILMGLLSLALAGSQFSDLGLENYHQIDFRVMNWVYLVTGAVGFHMVSKNYGSIAAKTLYNATVIVALFTVGFYVDTIFQVIERYKQIKTYTETDGGQDDLYSKQVKYHIGRIVVCGVMIGVGVVEVLNGVLSERYLRLLASDLHSNLRRRELKNRGRMAFVAFMKLFFGIATIGLGAGLEHLYKQRDEMFKYIKIGWELCAGAFAIGSAFVDFYALYSDRHNLLNLKVSLIFSVITSVLSLKTVDYMMRGFFLEDVRDYTTFDDRQKVVTDSFSNLILGTESPQETAAVAEAAKEELFKKFGIHAGCIAALIILFFHCVISAVEAGSLMERVNSHREGIDAHPPPGGGGISAGVDSNLHQQRNCLGVFQFLWGTILVTLCIISLVPWEFSKGYTNGPGVLWIGLLFITAGSVTAGRLRTLSTSVYVTAVVSSVIALEYLLYTVNELIQAIINPKFEKETETVHTGRIVLFSVQLAVLLAQFLTASAAANALEKVIKGMPVGGRGQEGETKLQSVLALCHILYAIVTIGIGVVYEIAVWRYTDVNVSIHSNPFIKITSGPIVFVTAVVQLMAAQRPQFLLSAGILQTVCAAIALFVMAPATSNLHYLFAIYRAHYDPSIRDLKRLSESEETEKMVMEISMGLTGAVILVAILEYAAAVVSALNSSFLIHHHFSHYVGGDGRFSTITSRYLLNNNHNYHHPDARERGGDHDSRDSRDRSIIDANGSILTNGARKYFGNEYRTYGENRMYSPNGVQPKTGDSSIGGGTYGYVYHNQFYDTGTTQAREAGSQTNIRHVFQNGYQNGQNGGYSNGYNGYR